MCIHPNNQAPSQEPPSPSSPQPTNTEPQPEPLNSDPQPLNSDPQPINSEPLNSDPQPINSEPLNSDPQPINSDPQPSPESASESRKRAMPEPYSPEPNPKPKLHGAFSSSTPPSPLIPVQFTDDFVKDLFKYLPMPLEELNRQSPSNSTLPPPPPTPDESNPDLVEDLFKFLPETLFDEPEPLNTIYPLHEENYPFLGTVNKDWTPSFPSNIDERISALADPIDPAEVINAPYLDRWDHESNLRRRKVSNVISPSNSYVPVDHAGNADVPVPIPGSRLVGAGIENLKNTCFMAAVLQCLTHTGQMFVGIRHCFHDSSRHYESGFCVICAFSDHNDRALDPSRNTIYPTTFLDNVKKFSTNFVRHRQEDAHEFLICALNKLKSAFSEEGQHNLIEQIFGGEIVSKLRCRSCGFSSDSFEPILDMGLGVQNVVTVQRALESYIMVENMDGIFKCSGCDQEVYMEKQLLVNTAPENAILHLKRFKGDGSTYEKIESHVYFTMELDLEPYTFAKGRENPNLMYDLYAVVVHSGSTANSGHYFSYVRSDKDNWHLMDDSQVFSVTEEHVLAQQAYMLFYKKRGTAWFSSIVETEEKASNSKSIDNTQNFGSREKDYIDWTEATDNDSPYAKDDDSMLADDNDSTYGIDTHSPDGKEKTASDMEEEECDSACANDKDSKDADDNDSKVTNEKSASGMDGGECDLAGADDKDSKDADDNDSKVTNEKSVSGMDGGECDLADTNDDKDSKDANEKSASGMDGEECDLADANDKDSKDANEKSASGMDGEECDLADANDKDSKDANDNDSKDANEKSVSGMDGADDNDSKDSNDNDSKDANEKSVSGMNGADDNDSKDANDNDSKHANDDNDSKDANDKDSEDANDDNHSKDANEKSVSGIDGADDKDSKDANEKSVSGMDGADDKDSKDANDDDDSTDANDKYSKDANANNDSNIVNDKDSKDANDGNDSKDANDNDSKIANEKSVSGMDGEECDLADANDKDSKDANDDNDSEDANDDNDPQC